MTILSNHKINTYLLKATRNDDLVARHATIVETKKFLADLEQDSRAELLHYGLAEMVTQLTPMPTKAYLRPSSVKFPQTIQDENLRKYSEY